MTLCRKDISLVLKHRIPKMLSFTKIENPEKSYKLEITKILKSNESTVKSQLLRARALLKDALKGEYDLV